MNENSIGMQLEGTIDETTLEAIVTGVAPRDVLDHESDAVAYLDDDLAGIYPPAVLVAW